MTDTQKTVLADHHNSARQNEQLLKWLTELTAHKKDLITECEIKIQALKASIADREREMKELESCGQRIIRETSTNLEKILKKTVAELGIATNVKVRLAFEHGEPTLYLHDERQPGPFPLAT